MTASKAELKGCDLKKQSQFAGGANERNVNDNKGLWRKKTVWARKKQNQFKANFKRNQGFLPMAQEIATALRASQ